MLFNHLLLTFVVVQVKGKKKSEIATEKLNGLGQIKIIIFRINFSPRINKLQYNGENFVNKHHQMQNEIFRTITIVHLMEFHYEIIIYYRAHRAMFYCTHFSTVVPTKK